MRGIDVLQSLGVTCKVLQMEGAKDPDEYVLKYGPDKFNLLIDNSITAIEYKIKMLKKDYNLKDTTDKIRFLNKMAEVLSKVPNNIERDIYIEKLSSEVGVGKEALVAEVEKFLFKDQESKIVNINVQNSSQTELEQNKLSSKEEETILYVLTSKDMDIYNKVMQVISVSDFKSEINKNLFSKIIKLYEDDTYKDADLLTVCENDEETNLLTKIMLQENTLSDFQKITDDVLNTFSLNKLNQKKQELILLIKQTDDKELKRQYEKELSEIIQKSARK